MSNVRVAPGDSREDAMCATKLLGQHFTIKEAKGNIVEKGIKLTGTSLRNFAGFAGIEVKYPDGVSFLCANNGGGKSTLTLVQLQACIKGIAESQSGGKLIGQRFSFIGPAAKSADVSNRFHDERTDRYFSISNHITAAGNSIKVQPEDKDPIPPEWMSEFLSVSLMSEKHFCSLSGKEQALALGIDTKIFDDKIAELKEEAREINRAIKAFGEITVVEECLPVNIDALKERKKVIVSELNELYLKNKAHNSSLMTARIQRKNTHDGIMNNARESNREKERKIGECERAVETLEMYGFNGKEARSFIATLPLPVAIVDFSEPEPEYIQEMPDDAPMKDIDSKIEAAYETNRKAERYSEFVKKVADKAAKVKESEENDKKQEDEKQARINYIKQFDFGFLGLTTNEDGELQLNGRPIKEPYFSTGERIKIVAKLMRSRSPLFKTVFLDSYCELDEKNGPKLLEELVADGFQPIVSVPNETPVSGENCIILRECKIANEETGEKLI